MKTSKFLLAGLAGGVTYFILGFSMYGTSDLMTFPGAIADMLVNTVMFSLTGGVVGLVLGLGKEAK
jgi:hypothetical protein